MSVERHPSFPHLHLDCSESQESLNVNGGKGGKMEEKGLEKCMHEAWFSSASIQIRRPETQSFVSP